MRFSVERAAILSGLAAVVAGVGCAQSHQPPGPTVSQVWERPTPSPGAEPADSPLPAGDATTRPGAAGDDVGPGAGLITTLEVEPIAYVNGQAIERQRATDILIDAHGLEVVELLIRLELARSRAASLGCPATLEEVRAEYDLALQRISSPVSGDEQERFDRQAAERLLESMLARNGVSKTQFMLKIEQDAHLRKVAERDVIVRDDMLAPEHDRAYGERVQVRHIQLNSLAEVAQVRAQLEAGLDFELLVPKYSRNEVTAAAGGLLPPFSRHDDVPPMLRQAAFSLQEGQVSNAIFEGGAYHLIRLERRFPPSEIPVELVRDELRARLRRRLIEQRMRQLAADLFDRADLQVTDPALLRRFREKYPQARIR